MPNKTLDERIALFREKFIEDLEWVNDIDRVDGHELESFIKETVEAVVGEQGRNLPEEKIIHSYMETQGDGHSKEYCEGWNDYRMVMIESLFSNNLSRKDEDTKN